MIRFNMSLPEEHGFTQDHDDAHHIERYLNPLPRSISRLGEYELLDGEWRFAPDLADRGLQDRWYLGHAYEQVGAWPGSVEEHLVEVRNAKSDGRPWQDKVTAWYERDFMIPEPWLQNADTLVQVTFGACGYETRVWLNGHPLETVEGERVHYGQYTSFSYELPRRHLRPVNRLTVRIADSLDAEIPRGKQESHVYKRGGIWYQTYTGAVRSVWIEPVMRNRLRSRLGVISSIDGARFVEFVLTARVHDPGLYLLRVVVAKRETAEEVTCETFGLHLDAGEKVQRVVLKLPEAQLWAPEAPHLYHLTAQLEGGPGGTVSQIEAHFGLRKVEARGPFIYLNNCPVYLDGILYQPGLSTFDGMRRHLLAMQRLGCNLVRVHITGIDPRIYDLADEVGMLLWVEVPSPHRSSERSRQNHWEELKRMLVIIASHPSVVILSLYNEDWGIQDVATNPEVQHYLAETYAHLRLHYPEFLVVDNDGWQHVSTEGRLESHLLTAHLYTPDLDRWGDLLDRLVRGETEGVTAFPLVVGDPFFYRGQVPLVISEWGGFGFVNYGGPEDPEGRASIIRAFKEELRRRPVAGDVYTQATDIEEERNGLISPETGDLLVPAGLLKSDAAD